MSSRMFSTLSVVVVICPRNYCAIEKVSSSSTSLNEEVSALFESGDICIALKSKSPNLTQRGSTTAFCCDFVFEKRECHHMSKNNAVVPPGLVSWRLDKEDDLLELTAVRRIRRVVVVLDTQSRAS